MDSEIKKGGYKNFRIYGHADPKQTTDLAKSGNLLRDMKKLVGDQPECDA